MMDNHHLQSIMNLVVQWCHLNRLDLNFEEREREKLNVLTRNEMAIDCSFPASFILHIIRKYLKK